MHSNNNPSNPKTSANDVLFLADRAIDAMNFEGPQETLTHVRRLLGAIVAGGPTCLATDETANDPDCTCTLCMRLRRVSIRPDRPWWDD